MKQGTASSRSRTGTLGVTVSQEITFLAGRKDYPDYPPHFQRVKWSVFAARITFGLPFFFFFPLCFCLAVGMLAVQLLCLFEHVSLLLADSRPQDGTGALCES